MMKMVVIKSFFLPSPCVVSELDVGVGLVFVRVPHPHLQVRQWTRHGVVSAKHRNFGHSVRSSEEIKVILSSKLLISSNPPSEIYSEVGIVVVGLGLSHADLVIINSVPSYIGTLSVEHTRRPNTYIFLHMFCMYIYVYDTFHLMETFH